MKTATTVKYIAALMLASALTAYAQGTGGGGAGGQHQGPPPADKIAEKMMEKFDANKDSELTKDELVQMIGFLHEHRPQGGADGGKQGAHAGMHRGASGGGQSGGGQGGAGGQRPTPPSPDMIADKMIEKFSSDKKGLTTAELTKAIEDRRAHHGPPGGGQHGGEKQGGASTVTT